MWIFRDTSPSFPNEEVFVVFDTWIVCVTVLLFWMYG